MTRVENICRVEGISAQELQRMVDLSAPYSRIHGFNRRFHSWVLDIRGGVCQNMRKHDVPAVNQPTDDKMFEPHRSCSGRGCQECGWSGEVIRYL